MHGMRFFLAFFIALTAVGCGDHRRNHGTETKAASAPIVPPPLKVKQETLSDTDQFRAPALLMRLSLTATAQLKLVHIKVKFNSTNKQLRATYTISINGAQRGFASQPVEADEVVILSVYPFDMSINAQASVEIYGTFTNAVVGDKVTLTAVEIDTDHGTDLAARTGQPITIK